MSIEINRDDLAERIHHYRAVCTAAVVSLLFGFVSFVAFLLPQLLILPLLGTVISISALARIKNRPRELTGKSFALVGLVMCSTIFTSGLVSHIVIFATEVPDGYQRISFYDLQPDKESLQPIPPSAVELDGKRIFVKGYVFPGDKRTDLKQFILVPDMGTCCFGGQPALTDMIEVSFKDPLLRADFSYRKRRLGGIFHVDTTIKPISGLQGVYYQLQADYFK